MITETTSHSATAYNQNRGMLSGEGMHIHPALSEVIDAALSKLEEVR
jgi:hypothetical protein